MARGIGSWGDTTKVLQVLHGVRIFDLTAAAQHLHAASGHGAAHEPVTLTSPEKFRDAVPFLGHPKTTAAPTTHQNNPTSEEQKEET